LALVVAAWMTLNLLAAQFGCRALDPPPFFWLEGAVSLGSLYIVVLILATQRREDQLSRQREQLTLELTILSEQKTAKISQLLEESHRDNPQCTVAMIPKPRPWLSRPIQHQCSRKLKRPMRKPSTSINSFER
jgi:uncharacterized membrane protein